MENFKLNKVNDLSPTEAKVYISRYFYPLTNGDHAMRINDKFEIIDKSVIKDTYFNRMSKELQNYYFKEIKDIKKSYL